MRVFRQGDADVTALVGAAVCVVGFGNLGASMAHNLREAGLTVTVGNVDDEYRSQAAAAGFAVDDIVAAVAAADVVYVLVPDEAMPSVFARDIKPALRSGAAVCFASGYCLAFGLVEPPPEVDVLLLAPRMLGSSVRSTPEHSNGFVSFIAVEQDATGHAERRLLALAAASGTLRRGAFELRAREEAHLDLLVEQTVGPYLGIALQLAFEVGAAAGLPPEALVLELYQSGEMAATFQTFADAGFYRSVNRHGVTAQFGGYLRTIDIDIDAMRRHFEKVLDDIRSGGFARSLQHEHDAGYPIMRAIDAITRGDDPMSQAEARVQAALRDP
ncbi:MAG TPA: NAD(P)-binding domain-containing protein [Acidimicrobiales bacterium]|nr:NAD(P)-binding domain-containing protein [Acidimicrobiales bacterium]